VFRLLSPYSAVSSTARDMTFGQPGLYAGYNTCSHPKQSEPILLQIGVKLLA
jgi:hypothetical protein